MDVARQAHQVESGCACLGKGKCNPSSKMTHVPPLNFNQSRHNNESIHYTNKLTVCPLLAACLRLTRPTYLSQPPRPPQPNNPTTPSCYILLPRHPLLKAALPRLQTIVTMSNSNMNSQPSTSASNTMTIEQRPQSALRLSPPSGTLRLRAEPAEERHIQWAEDVIDNEDMGKKSSKGTSLCSALTPHMSHVAMCITLT